MTSSISIMADIGGTNTRVALAQGTDVDEASIERFRNSDFSGLEDILNHYLNSRPNVRPSAACAAIAGPVNNGQGTLTNLDWFVDRNLLKRATGAKTVSVINDLQAQGHALEHLSPKSTRCIQTGRKTDGHAARLVIGLGTGVNAAGVFRTDAATLVPPAEAGHVDMSTPTDDLQSFATNFVSKHGFCSAEDAISGRGLTHLYDWLTGETKSPAEVMDAAKAGDSNAQKTVEMFSDALAAFASNLALTILPFGGLYLVGGVSRNVAPYLETSGFTKAFCTKGRFSEFLEQFPIYVVEDDYAALTGMAGLLDEIQNGPVKRL